MGGRNGLLLTRKGEDEEIIYALVRKAVVISESEIALIYSEYKKMFKKKKKKKRLTRCPFYDIINKMEVITQMLKGFKVKILPNEIQKKMLFRNFGVSRWAYNWALNRENENYKQGNKFLSDCDLRKELTKLKSTIIPDSLIYKFYDTYGIPDEVVRALVDPTLYKFEK